jgi:hypothetical protein
MNWTGGSATRIYLRVALTLIVVLAALIALVAGDHWRKLDADAGPVAFTMAHRPEPRPHKSASALEGDEQLSRPEALAFLILMLKEGRSAR